MSKKSKWTQFHDMHSGGGQKLKWARIYIEAPQSEAEIIFQNRLGRNPHRVTCSCCGEDYSLTEADSLEEASWYERGCRYGYVNAKGKEVSERKAWIRGKGIQKGCKPHVFEERRPESYAPEYKPVSEYIKQDDVLVIRAKDIKASERKGELNQEGYVWAD